MLGAIEKTNDADVKSMKANIQASNGIISTDIIGTDGNVTGQRTVRK